MGWVEGWGEGGAEGTKRCCHRIGALLPMVRVYVLCFAGGWFPKNAIFFLSNPWYAATVAGPGQFFKVTR